MRLLAAKAGEKFFVQVRVQKPDNNFTNRAIAKGLLLLGIAEESTQEESRTEEHLKKFYEVPPSFVSSLLKKLDGFKPYFVIYHSFYGGEKTKYEPAKGNALGTKPKKKWVKRKTTLY